MQVREIMTKNPACCTPDTNLQEVARMMLEHDCGLIPVVDNQENKKPVGTITDRDIAIRTVAAGQNPIDIKASNVMTMGVTTVTAETDVQECCDIMENKKIRRVLVVDESGAVSGIVAQADVAEYGHPELVSNMLEEISESPPSPNPRRSFERRSSQPYSQQRSSFRTETPRPLPTENAPRFRSEKHRTSTTEKSSFGLKSILPLLVGIGTGAALNYYLIPAKESKSRVVARRDITDSTRNVKTVTNKTPLDLTNQTGNRPIETKEVITGSVTSSSTQKDKLNTKIDSTRKDETDNRTEIGRSAS